MRDPTSYESQLYADAIMDALDRVARQQRKADMGAVLGALVAVQARFLAGINDTKLRKTVRRQMDAKLTSQIVTQIDEGQVSRIEIVRQKAN